jgi:hypothetical protein
MARNGGWGRKATTATANRAGSARSQTISAEEIAKVAYELFERRGRTHGNDQQDWFEAERILRSGRHQGGRGVPRPLGRGPQRRSRI